MALQAQLSRLLHLSQLALLQRTHPFMFGMQLLYLKERTNNKSLNTVCMPRLRNACCSSCNCLQHFLSRVSLRYMTQVGGWPCCKCFHVAFIHVGALDGHERCSMDWYHLHKVRHWPPGCLPPHCWMLLLLMASALPGTCPGGRQSLYLKCSA